MGYRINERNSGHWTIGGEPKRRRQKKQTMPVPVLTDEQMRALDAVEQIEGLLRSYKSDYYSYVRFDCANELHKTWLGNGVAVLLTRVSKYAFADPDTILAVNPEKVDDLILVKNLLIEVFRLQPAV